MCLCPYRRVQELASALVEDLQIYTPQGGDALVHKATAGHNRY